MTSGIQNDSSNARKKNVNSINEWKPPLDWDFPLPVDIGEESHLCLYNNGVSEDFDAVSVDSGYSLMSFSDFVEAEVAPDVLHYGTPLSQLGYTPPEGFEYDQTEVSLYDRVHAALGDNGSHILHYLSFAGVRPPVCFPFESHKEAVRSFKQGFCIGAYLLEMDRFEQRKLVEYCEFAHKNARKKSSISLPRSQYLTGPARVSTKKPSDDVHILYARGYPRVPKPNSYDVHSFRVWVHGESSHIWRTSTTEIPVLGHSALALYKGSAASAQANAQMLGLATVQRSNWSTVKCQYSTTDPLRTTITVGMFHFTSMRQFELLAHLFSKHKPLYKTLGRFFDGDSTVDGSVLSATLEKVLHTGTWDEVAAVLARESFNEPVHQGLVQDEVTVELILDSQNWPALQGRTQDEVIIEVAPRSLNQPVRQGLTQSTTRAIAQTLHDEDHMTALGRDFGSGVVGGMKQALPEASVSVIRMILNSILGLANMAMSQTPLQFSCSLAQTLINDPVAASYADRFIQPYLQGGEESEQSTQWYTEVFSLGVFSSLREFLGDVYAALIPSFLELCGALKFASVKAMAQSAASWIADKLYELMQRVQGCWREKSLGPLWGVDPRRWCKHSVGIMQYWSSVVSRGDGKLLRELLSRDEIPPEFNRHMTYTEFCERLTVHLDHGNKIANVVTGKHALEMKKALQMMDNLRADVSISIDNSASRVKPFTVLFYSQPGTGKTTQADKLARALVAKEGRDTQDIYYFVNENFRTNLRSNTVLVRMDDPDATATSPQAGFEDHCTFLQKLSSSQPYPVEQAGVDEKGKHYARPTDIIIATNHKDLKAKDYMTEPGAVWRRIDFYVESIVKEQYSTNGRLNTKLLEVPVDEACTYNVYEYAHAGNGCELTLRPIASNLEWKPLCRFLLASRETHLTRQRTLLNSSANRCAECGFPVEVCVCEIPLDGEDREEKAEEPPLVRQGAGPSRTRHRSNSDLAELEAMEAENNALKMEEWAENIKSYFNYTNGVGVLAGATAVVASVLALVKLFRAYNLQGREGGVEQDSWFRASNIVTPAFPTDPAATWSYEDLCNVVRANLVAVKGIGPGGSQMHGLVYGGGWVLFPTHCFGPAGTAEFTINGRVAKLRKDHSRRLLNAELSVIHVSDFSCFNGVRKHMVQYPVNARQLSRATLIGASEYSFPAVTSAMQHNFPIWKYEGVTQDGDCGSALVAVGPGDAPRIFGVHLWHARADLLAGSWSGSVQVSANQVEAVIKSDISDRVMYQGNFKHTPPVLGQYPPKSEIGVATTFYGANVLNWGSFPGYGRTMKTAFKPTSFHHEVKAFCEENGVFHDYCPPEFRGHMTSEGLYFSPFIHALRETNESTTTYFEVVDDLVARIAGHYGASLTEREALVGVPGEFNSINRNSSMGPPILGAKIHHISESREELSPVLAEAIDELEAILARKQVPRIIAEAVLKDEVLKRGKPARVFCMLPAAFNIVCKRRFAVLKRAMRSSYFASGCAVGLDMGSRRVEDLVEFLLDYEHLYALDVSRMDKCWTPQAWDAVAEFIRRVVEISAGTQVGWESWALVMAMKEAIIYLKGDFFTSFWNISGNDITVELNSILLVLMLLKCCKDLGVEPFVITYGDDNITGVHTPLPEQFFQYLTDTTGFVFTDDKKNSSPTAGTIASVSFLKRSFVYEPRYRVWTAPLEQSSIAKMLLYRGRSTLSPPDHEAALVDAALRYALLHGEQVYSKWVNFLGTISTVSPRGYDVAMSEYVSWKYSDWIDREVVHNGAPGLGVKIQGNPNANMNVSNADAEVNAPLPLTQNSEASSTTTLMDSTNIADAVQVHAPGTVEVDTTRGAFAVYQEPPTFDLSDFMVRWTEIAQITVSSSNLPMDIVSWIDVNTLFLNNPAVVDKKKNFAFYRGDIEVMGVWTVPGNASGAYVAYLKPKKPLTGLSEGSTANCLSFEHSVLLQASESSDFILEAPFYSSQDVNSLDTPQRTWSFEVVCLSPIRTAIPGGVTTGHLKVFARFKPGYQFQVPLWQGKKGPSYLQRVNKLREDKTISRTASTIAGAAGMLSAVPVIGPIAAAASGAATTVAGIADFFGFSRENDALTSQTVISRSVGNVANVDFNDNMEVSGFSCRNKISIDSTIAGGSKEDLMSFASLSDRWVVVKSFPWSATAESGDVLTTIPVTPGYGRGSFYTFMPTGAGYCGLPFQYWRADAEYLIVIPASTLHRGALQVLYLPNENPPTVGASVTNVGMNAILNVSASTLYELKVGYSQAAPMKELRYFIDTTPIKPVGTSNGSLQFRVVNPLQSQNPVDIINVTVFARFKNPQFAVPRHSLAWVDLDEEPIHNQWEDAVELQGAKTDGDEGKDDVAVLDIVPGSGVTYPAHEVVSGESVLSLRALAQRPTRILPQHYGASTKDVYLDFSNDGVNLRGGAPRLTTASLALGPFVNNAYSTRVKVIPDRPCYVGAGFATDTQFLPPGTVMSHYPMTFCGEQRGGEFVLPFYQPVRGVDPKPMSSVLANDQFVKVMASGANNSRPKLEVYCSLGDDIRVGLYSGFPRFNFRRKEETVKLWMGAPSQDPA